MIAYSTSFRGGGSRSSARSSVSRGIPDAVSTRSTPVLLDSTPNRHPTRPSRQIPPADRRSTAMNPQLNEERAAPGTGDRSGTPGTGPGAAPRENAENPPSCEVTEDEEVIRRGPRTHNSPAVSGPHDDMAPGLPVVREMGAHRIRMTGAGREAIIGSPTDPWAARTTDLLEKLTPLGGVHEGVNRLRRERTTAR